MSDCIVLVRGAAPYRVYFKNCRVLSSKNKFLKKASRNLEAFFILVNSLSHPAKNKVVRLEAVFSFW
jgi:hypothetical protein